jgi:hypothetical protein
MLLFSPGHFGRGSKDKGNEEVDKDIGINGSPKIARAKKIISN